MAEQVGKDAQRLCGQKGDGILVRGMKHRFLQVGVETFVSHSGFLQARKMSSQEIDGESHAADLARTPQQKEL